MTEGTLIMDAIMRSSPSYQNSAEPNKYAAHAQQIYSKQIFGAINKYRFPIANLLAAAKYASAYSIAQQKGSVMIIPHGVPELTTIARKEKMEYQVSGLQNNTKINMELDNVYTDPNSGVRILVHHPTPSYANGAAAPTIDLASANLSDTSYVITKHQRLLKDNPTFFKDQDKCTAYCQDIVKKSLATVINGATANLTDADNLKTFQGYIEKAAGQVTEGLCGFNAQFGSGFLDSVAYSKCVVNPNDADAGFLAMPQHFTVVARTKKEVPKVYLYNSSATAYTSNGDELDHLDQAFKTALDRTAINNKDADAVSSRHKIESIIACYAMAYKTTSGIDNLDIAFQRLQTFASFVHDALPPGAGPVAALLASVSADTIIGTSKQNLNSYIVLQMANSQYHEHATQVRSFTQGELTALDGLIDAWKIRVDTQYSGSTSGFADKKAVIADITKTVKALIEILTYILASDLTGLAGDNPKKFLSLPKAGKSQERAIRVWNSYSADGDPLVANVTFDYNSPKGCVEIADQNYNEPNTGYLQIPDIESGGLKAYTATTVIRVAKVIASSAILAAPGDSTGQLLVGYPFTGVSTSATEERMRVQLRCYLGAALYQPDAVMIMPNVFVEGIEDCEYFTLARAEYGQIVEQVLCQMQGREGAFDPTDTNRLTTFKRAIKVAWRDHDQLLKCVEHLIELFSQNRLPVYPQTTNRAVIPDGTVYHKTIREVSNAGEFGILDDPVKYIGLHGVPQAYEHGEF